MKLDQGAHPLEISIVTPSFNQGEFLEAAIRSVLDQQYPALEYIVVDGGSTDGSIEIIRRYEAQLHRWCSEPDEGHYAAVNKGFSWSNGEIMAWLNSDDMYCLWTLALKSGSGAAKWASTSRRPPVRSRITARRSGIVLRGRARLPAPCRFTESHGSETGCHRSRAIEER